MIFISSSSCSCDCSAAEQTVSSVSFSHSLLGGTASSLTNQADFCFHCFFLIIGATDTTSDLAIVSVGTFSDPETLFSS